MGGKGCGEAGGGRAFESRFIALETGEVQRELKHEQYVQNPKELR